MLVADTPTARKDARGGIGLRAVGEFYVGRVKNVDPFSTENGSRQHFVFDASFGHVPREWVLHSTGRVWQGVARAWKSCFFTE